MKAHRTDGLSLVFGLVFLAVVAWWLGAQALDLSLPNAGWFVAATLILLGLIGLVGALRPNRGSKPSWDTEPAPAPTGDSPSGGSPTGDIPTGESPTGDIPTGESPTADIPADESPTRDIPTDPRTTS